MLWSISYKPWINLIALSLTGVPQIILPLFQHRLNKRFIKLHKCHDPYIELAFFVTVEEWLWNFNLSSINIPMPLATSLDDIVVPSIRYSLCPWSWPRWSRLHLLIYHCYSMDQSIKLSMAHCNSWKTWRYLIILIQDIKCNKIYLVQTSIVNYSVQN